MSPEVTAFLILALVLMLGTWWDDIKRFFVVFVTGMGKPCYGLPWHELKITRVLGNGYRKVTCSCGREWVMSDKHRSVLPWDHEFEDFYKEKEEHARPQQGPNHPHRRPPGGESDPTVRR